MEKKKLFTVDGVGYNVNVIKLVRKFSVLDSEKSGRTMDGAMYRDPIGTFYNYEMTVSPDPGDPAALDAFWEAISKPVSSHVCVFPYNQKTLAQRMYITSGEQELTVISENVSLWGDISLSFIAMEPKVTP